MKCNYCGEQDSYGHHTCRSEVVAKDVEIHSLEAKLKDAYRELEHLKVRIEAVLEWDYLHLTTDCEDGRQFYMCLNLLSRYYEHMKKDGECPICDKNAAFEGTSSTTGSLLNVVVTCAVSTTMRDGENLESITEYFRSNPAFLNGYVESVEVGFREAQNSGDKWKK